GGAPQVLVVPSERLLEFTPSFRDAPEQKRSLSGPSGRGETSSQREQRVAGKRTALPIPRRVRQGEQFLGGCLLEHRRDALFFRVTDDVGPLPTRHRASPIAVGVAACARSALRRCLDLTAPKRCQAPFLP